MKLSGKRAVVTGGSNGIGLALCTSLASEGATVFSFDQESPAKDVSGVTHVHCDVTKLDDVRAALAQTGGSIDVLVLNAGVIRRGPVLSHPENEFDLLFGVNAKGQWLMLKEAAPLLARGAIVLHVSSYRAGQDVDDPGLYAASKEAGEHIARCAAKNAAWSLKIARLGRFATNMALDDGSNQAPEDAAALLLNLITSRHSTLLFDPATNVYSLT